VESTITVPMVILFVLTPASFAAAVVALIFAVRR
jgi:hypothetical protein